MSDFKVFYSWQSDLPHETNWDFIASALEKAAAKLTGEGKTPVVIDSDIKGRTGSPDITVTILQKITECHVFVADLSLCFVVDPKTQPEAQVNEEVKEKPKVGPNPNVALELGYAIARLGWERIILVSNITYGGFRDLPFDFGKHPVIPFGAKRTGSDLPTVQEKLTDDLTTAIREIKQKNPLSPGFNPIEDAVEEIGKQGTSARFLIGKFQNWAFSGLEAADPWAPLLQERERLGPMTADPASIPHEDFLAALANGRQYIDGFSQIARAASREADESAALALWDGLARIFEHYYFPPGRSGFQNGCEHDWWKFHGYEMCVILVAHLLEARKLPLVRKLLTSEGNQKRWPLNSGRVEADFQDLSDYVRAIYIENQHRNNFGGGQAWFCPQGQALKSLRTSNPGFLPPWELFCEADLILALFSRSHLVANKSPYRWQNHTYAYLEPVPRFLKDARAIVRANQLKEFFGAGDLLQLKEWLKLWWADVDKSCPGAGLRMGPPIKEIDAIGTA